MRILLIGPTGRGGSLPPYLAVLDAALREHGARVDRIGTADVPYDRYNSTFWDAERLAAAADDLLRNIDLTTYDILSLHFGNLEIEQLLPSRWKHRPHPPAVYHVHSLDWTLFTAHVPNPSLRAAVEDGAAEMDGYVFFGAFARSQLVNRLGATAPATVSYLPSTIPARARADPGQAMRELLAPAGRPLTSLYGYAAPWKDPAGFLEACTKVITPCRALLAGPLWTDAQQAGTDLSVEAAGSRRHGAVDVHVIDRYLSGPERKALVQATDLAYFPYRSHSTFQGSGAIADYLNHGTPVIATDIANMAELVGDAGIMIEPGNYDAFGEGLERMIHDDRLRSRLTGNAQRRSSWFSARSHAAHCLRFYEQVAAHTRARRLV